MKQKIKIVAIVENHSNIILFSDSADGDLFLLSDFLRLGEQPDDRLANIVAQTFSKKPDYTRIIDSVAYSRNSEQDPILYILYKIGFNDLGKLIDPKFYQKINLSEEPKGLNLNDETDFILRILGKIQPENENSPIGAGPNREDNSLSDTYTIFTDGGSRGNPGISAAAYVIYKNKELISSGGELLGVANSSHAEYHSLRIGLQAAYDMGIRDIIVYMDNLMVVGQISGLYKIKNRELWPIHSMIVKLIDKFDNVQIKHTKRENNTAADNGVNQILDGLNA